MNQGRVQQVVKQRDAPEDDEELGDLLMYGKRATIPEVWKWIRQA
jgi:hypothetical protein